MPSRLERDLAALLPTKALLPPQLISLASSLLAQSKASAPKLKPQEEIAREYACAHIACQRLTNKLALDLGQVLPPCAPRVYNKLHQYLDSILTAGKTAPPATPTPKTNRNNSHVAAKPTSVTTITPPKLVKNVTPNGSLKRKRGQVEQEEELQLPEHMVRLGRHLCHTADIPTAVPHIYAGLERIYCELELIQHDEEHTQTPGRRARKLTSKAESLLPKSSKIQLERSKLSLVPIALAHYALATMRVVEANADQELEMLVSEALSFNRKSEDMHDGLDAVPLDELVAQTRELASAFEGLVAWQEWSSNIPRLEEVALEVEEDELVDDTEDALRPSMAKLKQTPLRRKEKHGGMEHNNEVIGAAGLLPGLGSMFQPVFDWLSDDRCQDYARWDRGIRRQLESVKANA